jgi:hypothetical protein
MSATRCGENGGVRRDGEPCRRYAERGRMKCRFHGGAAPIGPANGSWKHGRYSKYIPTGLASKYAEAEADPALGELRGEVALLQAIIAERVERLHRHGVSNVWWQQLNKTADKLTEANRVGDRARVGELLSELVTAVREGAAFGELVDEVASLVERKSRIASREWRRMVDLQQVMTTERALAMGEALVRSVVEHVDDREAVKRIADDVGRLFGSTVSGSPA